MINDIIRNGSDASGRLVLIDKDSTVFVSKQDDDMDFRIGPFILLSLLKIEDFESFSCYAENCVGTKALMVCETALTDDFLYIRNLSDREVGLDLGYPVLTKIEPESIAAKTPIGVFLNNAAVSFARDAEFFLCLDAPMTDASEWAMSVEDWVKRDEIIFGKAAPSSYEDSVRHFDDLSLEALETLVCEGFVDEEESEDEFKYPSVGAFLEFVKEQRIPYTFIGFVTAPNRPDARVAITGIQATEDVQVEDLVEFVKFARFAECFEADLEGLYCEF